MGLVVGVWIISKAYTRFFWQILSLLDNNVRKIKCIRTEWIFCFYLKFVPFLFQNLLHFLKAFRFGISLDFALSSSIMLLVVHLSSFLNFYPSTYIRLLFAHFFRLFIYRIFLFYCSHFYSVLPYCIYSLWHIFYLLSLVIFFTKFPNSKYLFTLCYDHICFLTAFCSFCIFI